MAVLRALAIASNVLFTLHCTRANLLPILLLHATLLPVNGWSLGRLFGGRPAAITVSLGTACTSCVLIGVDRAHLASIGGRVVGSLFAL